MKATLPNLKNLAGRARTEKSTNSENDQHQHIEPPKAAPEPKPPPALSLFFMLSHLEDDGPVRLDGVKLAVLEVMGLELDEPKLGAFAGSLNALDFPVQLLVRQHPPVLPGIPQIKPTFLDIAPAGIPPNIIPHSKGVKCGLMRPDSLKVPAFIGQPLYCQA